MAPRILNISDMPLPARLEFFKRIMSRVRRGWLTSFERAARNKAALGMMQATPAQISAMQQQQMAAYAQAAANHQRAYPQDFVFGLGNVFGSYNPFDP
jgi:hypothetical protein